MECNINLTLKYCFCSKELSQRLFSWCFGHKRAKNTKRKDDDLNRIASINVIQILSFLIDRYGNLGCQWRFWAIVVSESARSWISSHWKLTDHWQDMLVFECFYEKLVYGNFTPIEASTRKVDYSVERVNIYGKNEMLNIKLWRNNHCTRSLVVSSVLRYWQLK